MAAIMLDVLGPTAVTIDGAAVALRPRERDVLAALAVRHPAPVGTLELAELLWVVPPASDTKTLQNHVARIRRVLGPDSVVTVGSGYALGERWQLDIVGLRESVAAGRRASSVGDHHGSRLRFQQALQRVRGEPFAELEATVGVRLAREEIARLLDDAGDGQLRALLSMGDAAGALQHARGMEVAQGERRSLLVAIAHFRTGQRVEALHVIHRCRQALRERGVSPSESLLRVEQALLADDVTVLAADHYEFINEPAAAPAQAAVLLGRDTELQQLGTLLVVRRDSTEGGRPVAVVGPSGSGKTSLCNRLALEARLSGWTVVDCPRPRSAADVEAAIATAGFGPVLALLDDADDLTAGDWHRLEPGDARLMVLAACRRAPSADLIVVELAPLERGAVQRLIEVTVGLEVDAATADLVESVVAGSDSWPAMVIELAVEGAAAGGVIGVVGRVLRGLSPAASGLAAMIALATMPVDSEAVLRAAAAAGELGTRHDLADTIAARVIQEADDGTLRCRDVAVRDSLLASKSSEWVRGARHAWIAVHDADDDATGAVADHIEALPDWPFDDALARFDRAAQRADAVADGPTELRNRRRGLLLATRRLGPDHPEVLRREIGLLGFTKLSSDVAAAPEVWELIDRLDRLGDHTNLVRLVGVVSMMMPTLEVAPPERIVALIDRALALPADPAVRSEVAGDITDVFSLCDIGRCRRYAELAYALALELDDDELRCRAIESLGSALGHPADWPRMAELASVAFTLAERLDNLRRRGSALQAVYSAQLQFADPLCRASLDRFALLQQRYDLPSLDFIFAYLEATLLHIEGRLDECETLLERLGTLMPLGPTRLEAIVVAQLVGVRAAQGRLPDLLEAVERLVVEQPGFGLWQGVRCWAVAAAGDLDRVASLLDDLHHGAALPHTISWAGAMYGVARSAALLGEKGRCRQVLELLAPHSGLMAFYGNGVYGPIDLALAELHLAIGGPAQAATHLDVAERLVWRLHAPVFEPELVSARTRVAAAGA